VLYFYYGSEQKLEGFSLNGTNYLYLRDAIGTINGILDADGALVAQYLYDAWGNILSVLDGTDVSANASHIANVNPFRYRGYFYDADTGFYYLQSRYYDPVVGRFITVDKPEMLSLSVFNLVGANLFAYCYNNPTINSDPSGEGVLPVGTPGYFFKDYKSSVLNWANKYAPMSNGVEYGAIIYRFRVLFFTWYFMGETYKGFKTQNWYTVINGLGAGFLVSVVARQAARAFCPIASLTIVGFAHTHPMGHSNSPSGPDVWMKRLGWIVSLIIFPIAVYNNKKVSVAYF